MELKEAFSALTTEATPSPLLSRLVLALHVSLITPGQLPLSAPLLTLLSHR